MSKHRVIVLKIVAHQLTVTEAAEQSGLSRRHVQRLLVRYRAGGIEAVDPRSRRPASNPRSTPTEVVERVVELRRDLIGRGLDAGPVTIRWHLEREGLPVPSPATIHRILTTVTVIHLDTGEILSEHTIDPTRGYWRNQLTPPGRWPQKRQMSRDT